MKSSFKENGAAVDHFFIPAEAIRFFLADDLNLVTAFWKVAQGDRIVLHFELSTINLHFKHGTGADRGNTETTAIEGKKGKWENGAE